LKDYSMANRQVTKPMLVCGGETFPLMPIPLNEKTVSEGWLQEQLFRYPDLIPAGEIEPLFEVLIPVARELRTGAGALDLLYITPDGWLVLAETKLWRNPEARRSVVAQLIDYAKAIARWSYTDLVERVRKARGENGGDPLVELARDESDDDFDERRFVDTVSRNLRLGRFLLLIIGDGIREDVEQMAEYLGQTPQLSFTLGLVEMNLFRREGAPEDEFYVLPRIVTRTREVIRAVVEIREGVKREDVNVSLPNEKDEGNSVTWHEYYRQLEESTNQEVVECVRWMIENVESSGLIVKLGADGPLIGYIHEESGHYFRFGQLAKDGTMDRQGIWKHVKRSRLPIAIAENYMDELARLIPGAKRVQFISASGNKYEQVSLGPRPVKDRPPLVLLAPNKEQWLDLILRTVTEIQQAMDEREEMN
jgi:hypothetical protein